MPGQWDAAPARGGSCAAAAQRGTGLPGAAPACPGNATCQYRSLTIPRSHQPPAVTHQPTSSVLGW